MVWACAGVDPRSTISAIAAVVRRAKCGPVGGRDPNWRVLRAGGSAPADAPDLHLGNIRSRSGRCRPDAGCGLACPGGGEGEVTARAPAAVHAPGHAGAGG